MQVREYTDADFEQIRKLHSRSGFRYSLPDLSDPSFFSHRVVWDKSGIAMAGFLRLSAEAFLICDPSWRNAAWRDLALRQLHRTCRGDASDKGVADVNCFIPPQIEKQFGRRLRRLGWNHYKGQEWRCYSYEVNGG